MRIICRGDNPTAFTRDRALPYYDVLFLSLIKKGISLSMELCNWFKAKKGDEIMTVTDEAYLKQRRNLNPQAFTLLNDEFIMDFYHDNEKILDTGYIVAAIDGTDLEIPNTLENREYFGTAKNQSTNKLARAAASAIYDLNNDFIIDITVDKFNASEIEMAKANIIKALSVLGNQKLLIVFDRNYPSLEFFHYLKEKNIKFVIRLSSKDYKNEKAEMKSNDETIKIKHTNSRLQLSKEKYPEFYEKASKLEHTALRIVKVQLPSGIEEELITNLDEEEFNTEHIIRLYGQRWGVEEGFNTLKNKLKIESFTGYSKQMIYQDVYAQTLVYNMVQDMLHSANENLKANDISKEKCLKRRNKHAKKVNENKAIGLMKEDLINIMLCEDDSIRGEMFLKLIRKMQKYTSVIRTNRPSTKRSWSNSNKYKTNMKSSF
jgi:hypothetical protein